MRLATRAKEADRSKKEKDMPIANEGSISRTDAERNRGGTTIMPQKGWPQGVSGLLLIRHVPYGFGLFHPIRVPLRIRTHRISIRSQMLNGMPVFANLDLSKEKH